LLLANRTEQGIAGEYSSMLRGLIEAHGAGSTSSETTVRKAVIALVLLSIMLSHLRYFAGTSQLVRQPSIEEVVVHERRLEALKKSLPVSGVVGFVSDRARESERERRQRLASYALAPLLVVESTEWPLVIADFSNPDAAKQAIPPELKLRQDFGNGVLLFARDE
jgi:hypothetical protein